MSQTGQTKTFEEKCEYVAQFFKEIWDTPFSDPPSMTWSKGKPEYPPTAEKIANHVLTSTFPGLKLLELDDLEWRAGVWFAMTKAEEAKEKSPEA